MKNDSDMENGRVLAIIELGKGRTRMSLSSFKKELRNGERVFQPIANTDTAAQLMVTGVGSSVLENVALAGEINASKQIIDGLDNPVLNLVVDKDYSDENSVLLLEKLKKCFGEANKIGEQAVTSTMDANQLDEILQGNSDRQVTRELIASSSQPLTTIKTVDGDEVSHGGLRISKWNPVGDAYDLKACFVTHISPSTNTFKLKLSASGEVMHVHCKKKPKIFRLLRLANTYEQDCDLNVMTFKNTGTEKKRVEIVDIIDKKALGGQLMESIKKDCEEN